MRRFLAAAAITLAFCVSACAQNTTPAETTPSPESYPTLSGELPLIIAHRGASGLYPEHTAKAYLTAIEQGADFIEPDLAMTKDGVLIASHDAYLSETTDVADHPEFADRKTTRKTPFGSREDWWSDDFTLEEIKTLRARQRVAGRDHSYDDQFELMTLNEILDLVIASSATGRTVGLHIEAKWPSYFESVGLGMADPIIDALERKGVVQAGIPVFIQCFEPPFLAEMAEKSNLRLIQNLVGPPMDKLLGMEIKLEDLTVAGVGANKTMVLTETGETTDFVQKAHDLGLLVHVFTVRDDAPAPGFADAQAELRALFAAGVDGVWTDYPATAVAVRDGE